MLPITASKQMSLAENYKDLCTKAVETILSLSQKVIQEKGRFIVALSGGSTPQGVYSLMAEEAYRNQFDWKNIYFFLGDERFVPTTSPRSNYKMITDDLIGKAQVPTSNFYAVNTATASAEASADLYEKELIKFFALQSNEFPKFDLTLLGLGPDGHTASLFPGTAALNEKKRLVVAVEAQGIPEKRISITLPVINHSQHVLFLVSGAEKAQMLKNVLETKSSYPAAMVNPQEGKLWWLADRAASASLQGKYESF